MKIISIKRNSQFKKLYFSGNSCAKSCLVIYCRKNGLRYNRIGITVSKKIGNAPTRNRARRRISECYRISMSSFKTGFDIVLVARVRLRSAPFVVLNRALMSAASHLSLLEAHTSGGQKIGQSRVAR